jgi:hypothetical protein
LLLLLLAGEDRQLEEVVNLTAKGSSRRFRTAPGKLLLDQQLLRLRQCQDQIVTVVIILLLLRCS